MLIKKVQSENEIEQKLIAELSASQIAHSVKSFGGVTKIEYTSPTGKQVFVKSTGTGSLADMSLNTLEYHDCDFYLACR